MFVNPLWFWLSAALIIPIFIHLWNKKSGKPRLLGTFRFLPDEAFSAARKIELHEIPLLLIRGLMVLVVTALLVGLFWESDKQFVEEIWVQEVEESGTKTAAVSDSKVIEIPSHEIREKGWWNFLAQVDHQFQPERIRVEGDFSTNNFHGIRPKISAEIEWVKNDSESRNEIKSPIWKSESDELLTFAQHKNAQGIFTNVEAVTENSDSLEIPISAKLIINSANSEEINFGLKYAADYWQIKSEEQNIEEIARVESGDKVWALKIQKSENGETGFVGSNPITGISFQVMNADSANGIRNPILRNRNSENPVFFEASEIIFVVNGEIGKEFQSWIFAGLGSYLIQNSLGIDVFLAPDMPEHQREFVSASKETANQKQRKSAGLWLFSLLLILWITERWLAPRRGM
ncbi:MAG: BatA domain-containing protein [Balneolaceae bacterium]